MELTGGIYVTFYAEKDGDNDFGRILQFCGFLVIFFFRIFVFSEFGGVFLLGYFVGQVGMDKEEPTEISHAFLNPRNLRICNTQTPP